MNNLQIINIKGVECYEEDGTAYLKLETVARGLGFTDNSKGTEYVRWNTVRQYLSDIGFSQEVAKNDFIPENVFYRLAMKAKNEVAEKFQAKVADEIIPSIRKTGAYQLKRLTPEEIMRIQLGMLDDHDARITKLENNMTLDYGQQKFLGNLVSQRVIHWLGGKGSNAYRQVSKKVFSECNRDIKNHFNVNARNNIPKLRYEESVEYVKEWEPCEDTKMMIYGYNSQMNLNIA